MASVGMGWGKAILQNQLGPIELFLSLACSFGISVLVLLFVNARIASAQAGVLDGGIYWKV